MACLVAASDNGARCASASAHSSAAASPPATVAAEPAASEAPLAGDGLVGGVARIQGNPVVLIAEDFTVKGGSIGHPNAAKRTRLVRLALGEEVETDSDYEAGKLFVRYTMEQVSDMQTFQNMITRGET